MCAAVNHSLLEKRVGLLEVKLNRATKELEATVELVQSLAKRVEVVIEDIKRMTGDCK